MHVGSDGTHGEEGSAGTLLSASPIWGRCGQCLEVSRSFGLCREVLGGRRAVPRCCTAKAAGAGCPVSAGAEEQPPGGRSPMADPREPGRSVFFGACLYIGM